MEKLLLSIIAASALRAVSSHVPRQYHFVYELKNQPEARRYCREKYTDLATIDSMEDVKILNNMVDLNRRVYSSYEYRAWIGLYDDLDSWRWSLSDRSFYRHGETEFRNWYHSEPNNEHSGQLCTGMLQSGQWVDEGCGNLLKAVCVDIRGPNVIYVLTNKSMTWTENQSHCRTHYTDLASVRNMAENQRIRELLSGEESAWIGLFRDSWKWLDGSNSSFRYWSQETREPNNKHSHETCVMANFNRFGRWEDWTCDWKKAFVCYSAVTVSKQVIKVRLSEKNSSLDLNNPAVMEDILRQLKQRLKDQGMNKGVRLSWERQPDGKIFHKDRKATKRRNTGAKKDEL